MTNRLLIVSLFFIFITACNHKEISELKRENKLLKEALEFYTQDIENYHFIATVLEKSNVVKVGEEYEASVGMLIFNLNSPTIVQLSSFNNNQFKIDGDTLRDCIGEYCNYKIKHQKPGEYQWGGRIELNFFDSKIERVFKTSYIVVD